MADVINCRITWNLTAREKAEDYEQHSTMIGIIAPWEDLAQLDLKLSLKSFFTNIQMFVLSLLVTEPDLPDPILEIIQITCISFSLAHILIILHLSATTKVYNILSHQ